VFILPISIEIGIEGKYCLHFHKMGDCPDCAFRGNAIENSQQRGIIIHGTHSTNIESNVLYNVRGAYVYLEDGNEMWNTLAYNVAICPFPFLDQLYRGCTVPGTSNNQADTSLNQAAFYSNGASTNNFIGNRAANHFKYVKRPCVLKTQCGYCLSNFFFLYQWNVPRQW